MIKRTLLIAVLAMGVLVAGHYMGATPVLAQTAGECALGNLQGCAKDTVLIPTGTICTTASDCISWFVNVVFILATLANLPLSDLGGYSIHLRWW